MTEKEFEIEIRDETREEEAGVQLPLNFLTFGEIENDDVKVYIRQDTYKALEKLAASDTSKELGSILVGNYAQELGKTHVVISDYIEAKYTDASAATLTFTHETWDYVHKQREKRFPEQKILGWQHTHPSYGIFLSNYDMFIQENFFNMPFQIAYVIDPVQKLRGFFQWKNGKIEKLKGYYIYDELGKTIKIEQTKQKKAESGKKPFRLAPIVIGLLCLLAVFLSWRLIGLSGDYKAQQTQIAEQTSAIAQMQAQLGQEQTSVDELIRQLEEKDITIQNQDAVIRELQEKNGEGSKESSDDGLYIRFLTVTVQAGDSLERLCLDNGVDYQENKKLILALNDIVNPDIIYVGQTLLLPLYE